MIYYYIICAVIGYLIGSIPFGYIIVKLRKGIDIRTVGSGNIGATNVGRVAGLGWGILCFLLDTAKGFFPTALIPYNLELLILGSITNYSLAVGLGIIIGHLFPVYIRFRGGKGVATALGVFLVLTYLYPAFAAIVIWLLVFLLFRYVSLASIIAAVSLPISYWLLSNFGSKLWGETAKVWKEPRILVACLLVTLLVIIRHIPNIKRLIKGTEPKVELWGKKPQINTDEHR
jgi:glycerol-3-phosphate acyltransferase PlsY